MRHLTRALAASAALLVLGGPHDLAAADSEVRRILLVSTFGNRFAPWDGFTALLPAAEIILAGGRYCSPRAAGRRKATDGSTSEADSDGSPLEFTKKK